MDAHLSARLRKMWQKRKCTVQNCYLTIAHGTVSAHITLYSSFFPLLLSVIEWGYILDMNSVPCYITAYYGLQQLIFDKYHN